MDALTTASGPEPGKLQREQGLELVARCLAERLGADVAFDPYGVTRIW